MTMQQILKLIEEQGIMLESAKGSIPNLADKIAGEKNKRKLVGAPQREFNLSSFE